MGFDFRWQQQTTNSLTLNLMTTNEQSAEALVHELRASDGWPAPSLLRKIEAQGEGAIEPLMAAVREDADGWLTTFAVEFLARLHAAQAVPDLAAAWRRMDNTDYLDPLYRTYAAFGEPMLAPMMEIAVNRSLAWYTRGMAIEAAQLIVGDDPALIARLTEQARVQLSLLLHQRSGLSEDDRIHVANLVCALADCHDEQARPIIEAAFKAGIVDTSVIGLELTRQIYNEPMEQKRATLDADWIGEYERHMNSERRRLVKYISEHPGAENLVSDVYHLVFPQQLRQQPMRVLHNIEQDLHEIDRQALQIRQTQPARNTMKVGRNDPCFCGSGKKYKHCHGKAA